MPSVIGRRLLDGNAVAAVTVTAMPAAPVRAVMLARIKVAACDFDRRDEDDAGDGDAVA